MRSTQLGDDLYFAYGSNLNPGQMSVRCPGAQAMTIARLDDWQVRIGVRGVATIVEAPNCQTWGVLWVVGPSDVRSLDEAEGVAQNRYRPQQLTVQGPGGAFTARTYIEDFIGDGDPRPGYLQLILDGARHFDLPAPYCSLLAALGS
jgi:hypothetical protein